MNEYEDVLKEKDQEKRIDIVLTDAYGKDERQEAFCCYLSDYITFPFKARIRDENHSKEFIVLRFTSVSPHQVVCEVDINGTKSRMPLTEIEPLDEASSNYMIIDDYLKFVGEL